MRRALLLVLLLLLPGVAARPAAAHTALVSANPADGSTVAGVEEVVLRFDSPVQPLLSTVVVTGPDGVDRSSSGPVLRGRTELVQAVGGPAGAGRWQVAYRVVAGDGHPVVGVLAFQVAGPQGPAVATTPPATRSPDPVVAAAADREPASAGGPAWSALAVGAGAVLAVCVGLVAARRRRSPTRVSPAST